MLFNSYEFIFMYLPFTLVLYYSIAHKIGSTYAKNFLILMSLVFYSYWDWHNLPILLVSIGVNYLFGLWLSKTHQKGVLALGVAFNLLYLGYYKYTDFVLANIANVLGMAYSNMAITLPLGISFFTFTQTAYLVDVYRGETKKYATSDYLLFVTIFPHLIAGPILYHKDMIPQFSKEENYKFNAQNFTMGIVWFVLGISRKAIIADKLAVWANQVFTNVSNLTMLDALGGSLAYTLQLYFDFSGYSEMAIGLGLMLNYNLPRNFATPYRACSIIDFWRRWHMTLSAFLKNYLYIPLGGNRNGHHMRNILITMFLGGLWHGAGWTFILWGCLHGVFICVNHLWRKTKINLPNIVSWFLTFNAVNVAWIFFRANSYDDAIAIVKAMFGFNSFMLPYSKYWGKIGVTNLPISYDCILDLGEIAGILFMSVFCVKYFDTEYFAEKFKPTYWRLILLVCLMVYVFSRITKNSEFIYFQF